MANYENLKVIHVFDKKKLELNENYEDLILKRQVTFIDAFRPGLRILLAVFRPVGKYQRIEIPADGDFISVDYSAIPCIMKDGTPMLLYAVQHMKVTDEVTFDPQEVTDRWNDKAYHILRPMTKRERWLYEREKDLHPWMATVKMTDKEFKERFERDLGDGAVGIHFGSMYLDHWSWVCLDVFKHFYETGEFVETGSDYLDGQNEAVISAIVEAQGKTWDDVKIIHEVNRTA